MIEQYQAYGNVIFDNINIADYNAFSFYCNILDRPERDVEIVSVPGRNGDIILDNGRYKNIERVYQIQATDLNNIKALVSALVQKRGYLRLEDDYEPEYYFRARLKSAPKISRFRGAAASIQLVFDRMPQKYLKSSEDVSISAVEYDRDYPLGNPASEQPTRYTQPVVVYGIQIENDTEETFTPFIEVHPYVQQGTFPTYPTRFGIFKKGYRIGGGSWISVDTDDLWNNDDAMYVERDGVNGIDIDFSVDCETGKLKQEANTTPGYIKLYMGKSGLPKITPGTNYFYFIKDIPYYGVPTQYTDPMFEMTVMLHERRWEI